MRSGPESPAVPDAPLYGPLLDVLNDQLVKVGTIAKRWGCSPTHLGNLRRRGKGPAWVRLYPGGPVRYRWRDVLAYEAAGQGGALTMDRVALAVSTTPGADPGSLVKVISHLRAAFPGR